MDRTTAANYATIGGKRAFQDQNPLTSTAGTELVAADHQAWQEELMGIIEAPGIVGDAGNLKQAVQAIRRLAGANNGATITANATLTADQAGLVVVNATAGNITLTLPLSNSAGGAPFNFRIARMDTVAANSVSVVFAGADAALFAGCPMAISPRQVLHIGASGGTTWVSFYENAPSSMVATGGWERKPSGLIEQWGQGVTATGSGDAVTFPLAFPAACAGVVLTERAAAGGWGTGATLYGASGVTTTGFSLYAKTVAASGALTAGTSLSYFYRATGW